MEEELIKIEWSGFDYEYHGIVTECMQCDGTVHYWESFIKWYGYYVGILLLIWLCITVWFYVCYLIKKDEHPFKHAIKRSWPWWIILLLIPFVVFLILVLITFNK